MQGQMQTVLQRRQANSAARQIVLPGKQCCPADSADGQTALMGKQRGRARDPSG